MLTKVRGAVAGAVIAGASLVPVALATDAAVASCARHTTGVCKANSPHPRGTTAKCKDGSYSCNARELPGPPVRSTIGEAQIVLP